MKSVFGLIVNVVGPPVTTVSATFRVPLVAPTIWNQLPVTFTGSLNVMRDIRVIRDLYSAVSWRRS